MRATRRRSEDRQAELADAALRIIASRGIAALTTRNLANEVGLTSGAIFRHFASLEDLLQAVVARVEAVLESSYPLEKDLSPRARLERFVEARSTAVGSHVGIVRLMLSEQFSLALPEAASARLAENVRKTRTFVLQCLREGQAAGEIRDDVGAGVLALIVLGTMQMLALSPRLPPVVGAGAPEVRRGLFTLLEAPARPRATAGRRTR